MNSTTYLNDTVNWYLHDLTSRVVAKSGIPSDRYHLGKLILHSLKEHPEFVLQVDGANNETENSTSVLLLSVRYAICLKNMGIERGDVMVLMSPNHLDLAIPFYAALYLGIIVSVVDWTMETSELKETLESIGPKVIFCECQKANVLNQITTELTLNTHIITFDVGNYRNFLDIIDMYDDDTPSENYQPANFDTETTIAFLLPTRGTTGAPKYIASTHMSFALTMGYCWEMHHIFPTPTSMVMILAPLHCLTTLLNYLMSPIFKYTRLQSSQPLNEKLTCDLINNCKPTCLVISPMLMNKLIDPSTRDTCDFTCIELILLVGSSAPKNLMNELKTVIPNAEAYNVYGCTELNGMVFQYDCPPLGSCGKPLRCFQYRIVDINTRETINEPFRYGELWVHNPFLIKDYFISSENNNEAFENGWFKTGDIFFMDGNRNYYFQDRVKMMINYNDYLISPSKIENIIREHSGVVDVAVVGIPRSDCGEVPAACVVRREGCEITAQEIKDLVRCRLTDADYLRGGVVFLETLPMITSETKRREKLKDIVHGIKYETLI